MTQIEFCMNDEWLASGICDEAGDVDHFWLSNVSGEYVEVAVRLAEADGLEVERAQGQRIMFHPWNGAHFSFRAGVFGAFGELSDDDKKVLESADAAGQKAAEVVASEFATV